MQLGHTIFQLSLLMRILAKENQHSNLSKSYNEIMNQPTTTMTMRSQTRGVSSAILRTNNTQFHNSFLPQTIRDIEGQNVSYIHIDRQGLQNLC